jgi:deoxyribodipyrimidine photo-lyase
VVCDAAVSKTEPYGVHWFRRDLRVAGNPALLDNWQRHQGRVLGLFTFDQTFLSRPDFSVNRFAFFLATLTALRDELRQHGGDLLVLDVGPQPAFSQLMEALDAQQCPRPSMVTFNRDYEPFARQRDQLLQTWIPATYGIPVHTARDHLLFEPDELTKNDEPGAMYQVYSPFAKKWFERLPTDAIQERIAQQQAGVRYLQQATAGPPSRQLFRMTWSDLLGDPPRLVDCLDEYATRVTSKATVPIPPAGSRVAWQALQQFVSQALEHYHERRDYPAIPGTSQLSIFLKNGSLTVPLILAALQTKGLHFREKNGLTVYVKELAWREFYYHVLYHAPHVEHEAFLPRYRDLEWQNNEEWFARWQRGETGYPIVDAGMRQLNTTGWMHNRVRMIVASFLTKDLLIDWRWGERYFMQQLLDGDLAPNNGGWQWAASTGCDPQPYFRIFNPLLQSEKFDADGDYLRTYLPELRHLPTAQLHAPHDRGAAVSYPAPVVQHFAQKELALALYRRAGDDPVRDH